MFKQILPKFKDLNQKSENIFYGASFIFFFLFEEWNSVFPSADRLALGYIHYGDFTEYILDSFFCFNSSGLVVALFYEFIYEYGFTGTNFYG